MNIILVHITASNKTEVVKISKLLLNKKLAACTNLFPINSMFWWKKKIVSSKEWVVIAKTKNSNFTKIKKEVEKIHSYTVPCIIKLTSQANKKYFDWITDEIK